MKPTYFWLPVVIAEWEMGEVGRWGNGARWGEKSCLLPPQNENFAPHH